MQVLPKIYRLKHSHLQRCFLLISQARSRQVAEQSRKLTTLWLQLRKRFVFTEIKPSLTREMGWKTWVSPCHYTNTHHQCVFIISTHLLSPLICFSLSLNLTCFVCQKRRGGGGGNSGENERIACVQTDISLLKAKQICVCACPVILLLTCALTVGI